MVRRWIATSQQPRDAEHGWARSIGSGWSSIPVVLFLAYLVIYDVGKTLCCIGVRAPSILLTGYSSAGVTLSWFDHPDFSAWR